MNKEFIWVKKLEKATERKNVKAIIEDKVTAFIQEIQDWVTQIAKNDEKQKILRLKVAEIDTIVSTLNNWNRKK